ncbi:unnamed protein product [Chironomus riparius]|uniref:Uncharacterized protein n=1 Tax=Chironomus riparius TaxID=315576 RepID=A0A9N9S957_9DIPT|nr:unnamed protein product [Chironomus riparius]
MSDNLNDHMREHVKFQDLFESYPDAFNALKSQQIISVLSGNELEISKKFVNENKFYVERKFIPEDAIFIVYEYEFGQDYVYDYDTYKEHVEKRTQNKTLQEFTDELFSKNPHEILQFFDQARKNDYAKSLHKTLDQELLKFMHKNSSEMIQQAENEKILIFQEKINFEVRIFEECFKSGNLVLIWNAFDEIAPKHNEFVLNVLKSIYKTSLNIQLVCTRPLYSDQLRKAFKVRIWELVPFNEKEKSKFFREFFIFKNVLSENVEGIIEKIGKIVAKLNFNQNSFVYNFETPLMLRLIAEIYEDEKLFESANIYGIFKAFVENKIEIWLEKIRGSFSVAKKLLFNGDLKIILQKFALKNEYTLYSTTTLGLKMRKLQIMQIENPKDIPIEEISRMGILFINGKNNFEFSHKTFSEFLVAQFFIENIFEFDRFMDNDEAELRLEMFFYLTHQYGDAQQIITDFMTSYLKMKQQKTKNFYSKISKLLRTKFKNFFVRMLDTNFPKVFEFLFEFFKPDHDLLVDLLHVDENETFYTAIFNPNHFALFTDPKDIKILAQNCLNETESQKFLAGKNQKGKILFGIHFYGLLNITKVHDAYSPELAALNCTSFWDFFTKIKEILTIEEQKELFIAALSPKIYIFFDSIFSTADFSEYEKLWTNFENLLSQKEMQVALGDALVLYFEIFPNKNAGHEKFIKLFLKKAEKFLSNSQISDMILEKNILHEAHWDPASFKSLWSFLNNHTSEEQRKDILLQDDLDDKNFFFYSSYNEFKESFSNKIYPYFYFDFTPFKIYHRVLATPDAPIFDFTEEIYQNHFNTTEIQKIFFNTNDFLYYVIGRAEKELFQKFAVFLQNLFKGNERMLKEFLGRKIEPTRLSVFELVEDYRGLSNLRPEYFINLKIISDLYDQI